MAFSLLLLVLPSSIAATWIVDPAGGGDSLTVQGAIDLASSGDTIEIAAGTYIEGIDLGGRNLTLDGAGAAVTTIGSTGIATCLTAMAGETLFASDLSFSGCDALVSASGAAFDFTVVDLWGAAGGGLFEGGTWDWAGGALSWLAGAGLEVNASDLDWDGLVLEGNEVEGSLLTCDECDVLLTRLEVADNSMVDASDGLSGLLTFDGGAVSVQDFTGRDNTMAQAWPWTGPPRAASCSPASPWTPAGSAS